MKVFSSHAIAVLLGMFLSGCQVYEPANQPTSGEMVLTLEGNLTGVNNVSVYIWPQTVDGDATCGVGQVCEDPQVLDCSSGAALGLLDSWLASYSHSLYTSPSRSVWPQSDALLIDQLEEGVFVVIAVGEDGQNQPIVAACSTVEIVAGDSSYLSLELDGL